MLPSKADRGSAPPAPADGLNLRPPIGGGGGPGGPGGGGGGIAIVFLNLHVQVSMEK